MLDVREVDDRIRRSADALRCAAPVTGVPVEELRRTHRRRRATRRSLAVGAVAVVAVVGGLVLEVGDLGPTPPGIDDGREAPEVAGHLPGTLPAPSVWAPSWPEEHRAPRVDCEPSLPEDVATTAPGWEALPGPPLRPTEPTVAWGGDELLLIGGAWHGTRMPTDLAAFDPASASWRCLPPGPPGGTRATPLPTAVDTGALWLVADGVTGRFDLTEGRWERLADLPRRRTPGALVRTPGGLLALGSASAASPWLARYDETTDRWTELDEAPVAPRDGVVAWTGEEVLVYDARGGAAYDPLGDVWRELPRQRLSSNAYAGAWDGSRLVVVDYLLDAAAYDPATDAWTSLERPPLAEGECPPEVVALRDGTVVLWYCGQAALLPAAASVWQGVATPTTETWLAPQGDQIWVGGRPVAAGDVVLFTGGFGSGDASTWRFDPAAAAPWPASDVR